MATVNNIINRQSKQTLIMQKELVDKINLISRADYGKGKNTAEYERAITLLIERAALLDSLAQNANAIKDLSRTAR